MAVESHKRQEKRDEGMIQGFGRYNDGYPSLNVLSTALVYDGIALLWPRSSTGQDCDYRAYAHHEPIALMDGIHRSITSSLLAHPGRDKPSYGHLAYAVAL